MFPRQHEYASPEPEREVGVGGAEGASRNAWLWRRRKGRYIRFALDSDHVGLERLSNRACDRQPRA